MGDRGIPRLGLAVTKSFAATQSPRDDLLVLPNDFCIPGWTGHNFTMAKDDKKDDKSAKKEDGVEVIGTDKAGNTIIKKNGKTYIQRKELPSVKDLLAHGDPETRDDPKTWCEIIGYPAALALVFAISLLLFHHAPHHLAPPRKKYTIPGMQRLPIFHKDRWHQHPEAKLEEMRKKKIEEAAASQAQSQRQPPNPEGQQQQQANTEL